MIEQDRLVWEQYKKLNSLKNRVSLTNCSASMPATIPKGMATIPETDIVIATAAPAA